MAKFFADDFLNGMRAFGYVDGRDFDLVPRYAEGFPDRLPALAQELVALKPAVILAAAVNAAVPLRAATSVIPIVCPALADAVHLGLIASEARPGGNVTGIERAMETLATSQVDIVIVLQTGLLLSVGPQIAEFAAAKRLPTVYGYREHVLDGGLISYGVDLRWCYRRAAYFVDKILHGTPPGELPVEFPTKMMLSINLKTAKALNITVPPALLGVADEVIE